MKAYIIIFLIASCANIGFAQTDSEKKKLSEELIKRDKAAGQFNPAFFNDTKYQHQAVTIEFDNGTYKPVSQSLRAGKLPFPLNGNAPFVVSFIGQSGKRLGGYSIETPATVRSCEAQRSGPKSVTGKFTFEVLLPNNPEILQLNLSNEGKQIATIPIARKPDGKVDKR